MLTIHTDTVIYTMSLDNPPVASIQSGATLCFETLDCYSNQITREDQNLHGMDWGKVNPATGPVFVEGAQPGDTLKVEILDIRLGSQGVMVDGPRRGVTGRAVAEETIKILPISQGQIRFNQALSFPAEPMIGVIGTAPADTGVDTGTPAPHGGNMDCASIGIGTTLYLPVNVPGAKLALGDLHARMGDGEVAVCGVETAGAVTVRVTVIKGSPLPLPFLVRETEAAAICSAKTLDRSAEGAAMAMHRFLTAQLGMDAHEAGMLLSIVGQLRICQVVDPLKTCRMEIPLDIPARYGYRFP